MNIIKLSAIDSTNLYLKKMASESNLENFTVVVAEHQTKGRGQMGTKWTSEKSKNLTFSILINVEGFKIEEQFYLSMAISLGLLNVLKGQVKVPVFIKWPNDILAVKDKVAGVLIENNIGGSFIKQSIVGIGLNVNQENFSDELENVTSLKILTGHTFNLDELLLKIVNSIKKFVQFIESNRLQELKKLYIESLFKMNKPSMFIDKNNVIFLGKIVDVDKNGRLLLELENETIRKFNLKEIKFANR